MVGRSSPLEKGVFSNSDKTLSNPKILVNPDIGINKDDLDGSAFHVKDTDLDAGHYLSISTMSIGERVRHRKYDLDGANMSSEISPMSCSVLCSGAEEKTHIARSQGSRLRRELAALLDNDDKQSRRIKRQKLQTQFYGQVASKLSQEGSEKTIDDNVCLNPLTEQKEVSSMSKLRSQNEETPHAHPCIEHSRKMDESNASHCNIEESPICVLSSQDCDKVDDFERANQIGNADDDTNSRSTSIGKDISRTLKAITSKYGDITRDSLLQSPHMKVYVLLGICDLVQDLCKKQLREMHISSLGHYYQIVTDAECMKVNVAWLRKRLDEIKVAVESVQEKEALMNERTIRLQDINNREKELSQRKAELERLKSEVEDCEEQLTKDIGIVEMLDKKINALASKSSEFPHKFLMDGLL